MRYLALRRSVWAIAVCLSWSAGANAQSAPPSVFDETPPGPAAQTQGRPQALTSPAPGAAPAANAQPRPASGASGANGQVPAELDPARQAQMPPPRRSPDPLLPLGQIQPAWTDPVPSPGQRAPGVLRIRYERDRVNVIRTRMQMSTTINLPGCEKIEDLYPGDAYAFEMVQPRDNVVVVRPSLAGVDTSLTIVSAAGNVYNYYLRSEPIESKTVSDIVVYVEAPGLCRSTPGQAVRPTAVGRNGELAAAGRTTRGRSGGDFTREIPFDMSKLDFDCCRIYAESEADAAVAPVRVFSDEIFTYVDFGDRADRIAAPAAFLLRDGIDQPVNVRVAGSRGQILVVEALGDITLKSGERIVCIRRVKSADATNESVIVDPELGRRGARRY